MLSITFCRTILINHFGLNNGLYEVTIDKLFHPRVSMIKCSNEHIIKFQFGVPPFLMDRRKHLIVAVEPPMFHRYTQNHYNAK